MKKKNISFNIKIVVILIIFSIAIAIIAYYMFLNKVYNRRKANENISKIEMEAESKKLEEEIASQEKIDINKVLSEVKKRKETKQNEKKDKKDSDFQIVYVYEKEMENLPKIQIKDTDIMINNLSLPLIGNKIPDLNTKIYIYTNNETLSQNVYQTLKYATYSNIKIITGFNEISPQNMDEIILNNEKHK